MNLKYILSSEQPLLSETYSRCRLHCKVYSKLSISSVLESHRKTANRIFAPHQFCAGSVLFSEHLWNWKAFAQAKQLYLAVLLSRFHSCEHLTSTDHQSAQSVQGTS